MTQTHNFLPGDRVVNGNTGALCTVKPTPEGRNAGVPYVFLDADPGMPHSDYSMHNAHYLQLKPVPITVGSWVRVIGPDAKTIAKYAGKTARVLSADGMMPVYIETERFGDKATCTVWTPENLRAVAAPVAVAPSKHNFLPGDLVVVSLFPGPNDTIVTVKETPAERKTFHENDFVYFDDPRGYPFSNNRYTELKPAPIAVGSWVRVTGEFRDEINPDRIGYVFKVERMDGSHTHHTMKNGRKSIWHVRHLRAVAAPVQEAEMIGTVDLASEPDRTVFTNDPAHLKQAQELAQVLHDKHFNGEPNSWRVAGDMTRVLNQIDNMTANMVSHSVLAEEIHRREKLSEQTAKLAEFIMHNVPGEPSEGDEGAVDCAIRALKIAQNAKLDAIAERDDAHVALKEAARLLRIWLSMNIPGTGGMSRKWLEQHDPKPAPVFKRGDLVTWGVGELVGRIVGPAPLVHQPWEVIVTVSYRGKSNGQFVTPDLASLRHADPSK